MGPRNEPRAKAANGRAADLDTVTIDVSDAVRRADDDRHRSFRSFLWRPDKTAFEQWLRACAGRAREERTRSCSVRRRRTVVRNDNRRAVARDWIEFFSEVLWHPHAPCGRRITRQLPGVHRDTTPGEPLHMGHLRPLVDV